MLVPQGTLVLVLDGKHVRLLRNRGRDTAPDLERVPNEAIRRCGSLADGRHEQQFAREVIAAVAPMLAAGTPLILIAPPHLLGSLRAEVPRVARRHIVAEIDKDLAGCGAAELGHRLHSAPA